MAASRIVVLFGVVLFGVALSACTSGPLKPAALDTRHESCAFCGMTVSDRHVAAQLVARGEEPRFFDEIGCMAQYFDEHPPRADAALFVADYRTAEWTPATTAVFWRLAPERTPMSSGLIAHASEASRRLDPRVSGGEPVSGTDIFGYALESTRTQP